MYNYNKNDKSYTFSSDEIDITKLVKVSENENLKTDNPEETNNENQSDDQKNDKTPRKKIEVIDGGNDLDISPVSEYIEVEKPKKEKRENIIIPEDNK